MKKLILIRHASAEPEVYPMRDFDRGLEPSGESDVEKLGRFILAQNTKPEGILSSSAVRTIQTSQKLAKSIGFQEDKIQTSIKLYNAVISVLKDQITGFTGNEDCLAMVAHNPGISQLASFLAKNEHYQLHTAAAVCLEFDLKEWSELRPASGKQLWYFTP